MKAFHTAILGAAVPLLLIAVSIAASPWFSFTNNALSDLGHATRSRVAPIFNLGLATGGLLIVVTACMLAGSLAYRLLLGATGYFLMLVGVFDEIYGRLHFYVSVAFFTALLLFLLIYGLLEHKFLPIASAIIAAAAWYLHFAYNAPRGAAIPELISVAAVLPPYLWVTRSHGKRKQQ